MSKSGRGKTFARSITLTFLLASMGAEALHSEEHHNPHGNRRERIEEARQRLSETLNDKSQRRNINSGGDPEPLQPPVRYTFAPRRRPEGENNGSFEV